MTRRHRADGTVLRKDDILATIQYSSSSRQNPDYKTDDIDHFGNRRIRPVGELIKPDPRRALRMDRVVVSE